MDYGSEINLEYVELGGIVGVFVKLDAAIIDEHSLENLLHSTQHQIRLIVRACREGSTLHREAYTKANERSRKNKLCHCRYCDDVFYCRADLANHQNRIHPTLPIRSGKRARKPCPTCGRMVLNLALHIRTKHTTDPVNYTSGIAQCRQCDETYSVNTDHASVCRLSPTCPDCKKTFSQWRVMNKHRKIVHQGEKISCQTCNKTYHDTQSLKKHMEAVHLKIKRVCPLCAATVTTLAGHMNAVHADNRNFPCVSCDKKFKSNYDLSRHRDSVHLGQKPACPICGKHLANLNQHIRVVHKQIRFPCTMCNKQMNTKAELRKHMSKMHAADSGNNQYDQKYTSQGTGAGVVGGGGGAGGGGGGGEEDQEHLVHENVYTLQQREMSEEQLIAQYLSKQSFNLPSNPLKQEVLNDPMILCKEEQALANHLDQELMGQSRQDNMGHHRQDNLGLRGQDNLGLRGHDNLGLRGQDNLGLRGQDLGLRGVHDNLGLRGQDGFGLPRQEPLVSSRQDMLGLSRQEIQRSRQEMLGPCRDDVSSLRHDILGSSRHDLLGPSRHDMLESGRQEILGSSRQELLGSIRQEMLGSNRLDVLPPRQELRHNLETNRHPDPRGQGLERIDQELERHGLGRISHQQNQSRHLVLNQVDTKLSNELETLLPRSYQPPLMSTMQQLPSWNLPLSNQNKQ